MDDDFYRAAIPEPTTILGLRLKPLSIGHLVILGRIRSSFVTEGEECTIEDLALSVLICSLTYKDGCALFEDKTLPEFMRKWHDKLAGVSWKTKLGIRKPIAIDFRKKAAEFADYIKRSSKVPYYSYKHTDFAAIECPSVQLVKVSLMRDLGFSDGEIMDRSWAMCLWDYVTLRAIKGEVTMVDSDAISNAMKVADAMEAAMKARSKCPA